MPIHPYSKYFGIGIGIVKFTLNKFFIVHPALFILSSLFFDDFYISKNCKVVSCAPALRDYGAIGQGCHMQLQIHLKFYVVVDCIFIVHLKLHIPS